MGVHAAKSLAAKPCKSFGAEGISPEPLQHVLCWGLILLESFESNFNHLYAIIVNNCLARQVDHPQLMLGISCSRRAN